MTTAEIRTATRAETEQFIWNIGEDEVTADTTDDELEALVDDADYYAVQQIGAHLAGNAYSVLSAARDEKIAERDAE